MPKTSRQAMVETFSTTFLMQIYGNTGKNHTHEVYSTANDGTKFGLALLQKAIEPPILVLEMAVPLTNANGYVTQIAEMHKPHSAKRNSKNDTQQSASVTASVQILQCIYICLGDSTVSLSLGKNPPQEGMCILTGFLTLFLLNVTKINSEITNS